MSGTCSLAPFRTPAKSTSTARDCRPKIESTALAYWPQNTGTLPLKNAFLFHTVSETWVKFDSSPPREAKKQNLYFPPDSELSLDAPTEESAQAFVNYTCNP